MFSNTMSRVRGTSRRRLNFSISRLVPPSFLVLAFLISLLLLVRESFSLTSTVKTRKSELLDWTGEHVVGYTKEMRDEQKREYTVVVGRRVEDTGATTQSEVVTTIELPFYGEADSLAESLWPAGLACAILCHSKEFQSAVKGKNVVELGCGLGLVGSLLARSADSVLLTDQQTDVIDTIREKNKEIPNLQCRQLDWRDEEGNVPKTDFVIGSDIAYYFFLLRPLMDTIKRFAKKETQVIIVGQANRQSLWDLFHNIVDGCYNQITDQREPAWDGTTRMVLHKLRMGDWSEETSNKDAKLELNGAIPIATIVHSRDGGNPDLRFGDFDYLADPATEASIDRSF